jgi:hypothetical protein
MISTKSPNLINKTASISITTNANVGNGCIEASDCRVKLSKGVGGSYFESGKHGNHGNIQSCITNVTEVFS